MTGGPFATPSTTAPALDRPKLPGTAWATGWLAVAGEVALVADHGADVVDTTVLSSALTAAVVAWFTAGVLAGRPVRTVVAVGLTCLMTVVYLASVLNGDLGWNLLHTTLSVAMLATLVTLVRSDYHRWQRRHHDTRGLPVGGVLLLAALAGLLGPVSLQTDPVGAWEGAVRSCQGSHMPVTGRVWHACPDE